MTGHRPIVPAQAAIAEGACSPTGDRRSRPCVAAARLGHDAPDAPDASEPAGSAAESPHTWTFDEVYDEHFSFVWRSVRRLGVPDNAVDDVVQDVFVVVHRRLPTFEGRSSVRSWLFGIALHTVRDVRRTLRRKPALLGGTARADECDMDLLADASLAGQDDAVARSEAVRMLHAVLDAMPDERREVFILAELEQMSVPEIADAVGTNVNTTYSRLRAARTDFEQAIARAHASDAWRLR